jgi:hypothetical protein
MAKREKIVLRGDAKREVAQSIKSFERSMRLLTRNAVAWMREDIRNDKLDVHKFVERVADEVSEIAESFAADVEMDFEEYIDVGKFDAR